MLNRTSILVVIWVWGSISMEGHASQHASEYDQNVLYTVQFLENDSIRLITLSAQDTLIGRISERVDLNGDGNEELIVFLDGCGNWGHCIYSVLTPEATNQYRQLWSEYLYEYMVAKDEFTTADGQQWNNIILMDRNDYGGNPPALMVHALLQYDGSVYRESPIAPYPIDTPPSGIQTDFEVQATITTTEKTYQLGRPIAKGWRVVCTDGMCYYNPPEEQHDQYHIADYPKAPIVLRINQNGHVQDFTLDRYEDMELFSIQMDSAQQSILLKDRYSVLLFGTESKQLSPSIIPGRDVDYREDAISGSLGSLLLFGNSRYVLGNAQGYGLFCIDFSDIDHPVEMQRYTYGKENTGQPYLFIHQDHDKRWTGILANNDPSTASHTIRQLYKKIEQVDFLFKDLPLAKPIEVTCHFLILHKKTENQDKSTSPMVIDYQKGTLHEGREADKILEKLNLR